MQKKLIGIYLKRFLIRIWDTLFSIIKSFFKDDCLTYSASISFFGLLSFIPLILLLFSLSGFLLDYLSVGYGSREKLFAIILGYINKAIPFIGNDFQKSLSDLVSRKGTLGIIGLGLLFLTSGWLFEGIEKALDKIFHIRKPRPFFRSQLVFLVFVFTTGFLVLAVYLFISITHLFISQKGENFLSLLAQKLQFLTHFIGPFIFLTLAFIIIVKYFCRKDVRWFYVFIGGIVFASLFSLSKWIFMFYLEHLASFSILYGSLASFMILILWIFYISIIFMVACQFLKVLQRDHEIAKNLGAQNPVKG